jgi:glycine oxidase
VKVIVIGGGVIGCSIAYHVQAAGGSAVLLERGEIGGEASGAAAGMLIAPIEDTEHPAFNELRRLSLDRYPAMIEEVQEASGIDVEYKKPGMLRVATRPEMAAVLRDAAAAQDELEWLDAEDVRRVEPALSHDVLGAAYSDGDADLNPGLWTNALAKAASLAGAEVHRGIAVTALAEHGVCTNQGVIEGDAVVIAAGPWSGKLASLATPPRRGQMLAYRSNLLHHAIWGEDGYLVPKPNGFLWAGATVEDAGFRKETTAQGLAGLELMATKYVPGLAGVEVSSSWAGLRPGSPDGLPVIGRLPGRADVFIATGHFRNGILLAPVTGSMVSELVLEGRLDERLAPFGPERFRLEA